MDKMVLWGQIRVDETKLEQIITLPIFTLVNLSHEWEQIMIRYNFLWARRVALSNVRNNSNFT